MDLRETDEVAAFRAEARQWLQENVPHGLPSGDTREGFDLHLQWEKALFEAQGDGDTTLTAAETRKATRWAAIIDDYNNGVTGPGHCDDE